MLYVNCVFLYNVYLNCEGNTVELWVGETDGEFTVLHVFVCSLFKYLTLYTNVCAAETKIEQELELN